jgi:hypothetical protein
VTRTGDWRLVAPWWRWGSQEGRATGPALQKYDTSDFVTDFLANPQRSLVIDGVDDRVQKLVPKPAPRFGGRLRALADAELQPTTTLKLFLPTHKRFYLVVCELHCEQAGFPNAHREEVCEAGFVVRRRRFDPGSGSLGEARKLIQRVERAVGAVEELQEASGLFETIEELGETIGAEVALLTSPAVTAPLSPVLQAPLTVVGEPYLQAKAELAAAREELRRWAGASGAAGLLEGWVTHPDKTGRWQQVKERPGRIAEATFPLYPLVPTAEAERHVGANRALWFGTVPTASRDHDGHGNARFDDQSVYEIRCWVRRHDPDAPKDPVGQDCCGDLTWSLPTERYQLAAHFDLAGTANQPVTIQLPDIPRLKAQAASLPIGKGASVKLVSPPGSSMKGVSLTGGSLGPAQICSMSIPLITIVAQFAISILMPIVVMIFQLYALLRLKFCIPPSLSLSVDELAALNLSLTPIDVMDQPGSAAEAAVKSSLTLSLGSAAAADAALAQVTPSALADTVRTAARPAGAARVTAEISPRTFEAEVKVS